MKKIAIFGIVICLMTTACQPKEELNDPRLFKPRDLSLKTYYNGFALEWVGTEGAESYLVEASKTEDFALIEGTLTASSDLRKDTLRGLEENTAYFVRIIGTKSNTALNSHPIVRVGTTAAAKSIFLPVNADYLSFTSALLEWGDPVNADRLVLSDLTAFTSSDVSISDADRTNRNIRLSGLTNGHRYEAALYVGTQKLGRTLWDMPSKPDGMITIDASNAASAKNLIEGAADGATIMFVGGLTYDLTASTVTLKRNLVLMGEPGVDKPKVYVKGFRIGGDEAYPPQMSLTFQRLDLSGLTLSGTVENATAKPTDQLLTLDMSTVVDLSVDQVKFSGCILRNYARSVVELNVGIPDVGKKVRINTLTIDDCLAYDLGRNEIGYPSLLSICSDGGKRNSFCKGVVIRNSTFHHLCRGVIEARVGTLNSSEASMTVNVENCTFDYFGKNAPMTSGAYWGVNTTDITKPIFDFKGASPSVAVKLVNTLWGDLFAERISGTFQQGAALTLVNSHMLTTSKAAVGSTASGFTDVSGSGDALFPQRAAYKYAVPSSFGLMNVGDQRWK